MPEAKGLIGPTWPNTTNPQTFSLLPKVINGGIAGMIGVAVIYPIDLVKTRMQNQVRSLTTKKKQYKNIADCFKQVCAKEGYFSLYRGSAMNILLITPEKSIKLTTNDMFRYWLTLPNGTLTLPRQMISGGLAGACQVTITTPMELLKIQMQDAGRVSKYNKSKDARKPKKLTGLNVAKAIYAKHGFRGLYRGYWITMCRDVSFSMIYFPLYSTLSDLGVENVIPGATPPFWWMVVSGLVAGGSAAFTVTPVDVIKTRLQTITKGADDHVCTSALDCAKKTMQKEGITAFYKGGALRMMVIAPLFGITQSVYYFGVAEHLFGL